MFYNLPYKRLHCWLSSRRLLGRKGRGVCFADLAFQAVLVIHNKCPPSTTILSLSNISRLLFYYTQSGAFSGVQPLQHPQWMTSASAAQNTHHFKMFQCNNVHNVLQWMTSACTHCSHCFTMFEWHGSLKPATKGPRLLSHQENIHCAQSRDPQTRSNPRCCS